MEQLDELKTALARIAMLESEQSQLRQERSQLLQSLLLRVLSLKSSLAAAEAESLVVAALTEAGISLQSDAKSPSASAVTPLNQLASSLDQAALRNVIALATRALDAKAVMSRAAASQSTDTAALALTSSSSS